MSQRQIDSLRRYVNKTVSNLANQKKPVVRYKSKTQFTGDNGIDPTFVPTIYDLRYIEELKLFVTLARVYNEDTFQLVFGVSEDGTYWKFCDVESIAFVEGTVGVNSSVITNCSNIGFEPVYQNCVFAIKTDSSGSINSFVMWVDPLSIVADGSFISYSATGGYVRNSDDGNSTEFIGDLDFTSIKFIEPTLSYEYESIIPNGAIFMSSSNWTSTKVCPIVINSNMSELVFTKNGKPYLLDPTTSITNWNITKTTENVVTAYMSRIPTTRIADAATPNPAFVKKLTATSSDIYGINEEGEAVQLCTVTTPSGHGGGDIRDVLFTPNGILNYITYKAGPSVDVTYSFVTTQKPIDDINNISSLCTLSCGSSRGNYSRFHLGNGNKKIMQYADTIFVQLGYYLFVSIDNGITFTNVDQHLLVPLVASPTTHTFAYTIGNGRIVTISAEQGAAAFTHTTLPLTKEL